MRTAMVPTLETERLTLRAWRQVDLAPFAAYYADPATAAFVGGTCSRNTAWHRMAAFAGHWSLRGYGFWALEENSTGQFVGYSGLSFPEGWPEPEVGWGLLKGAQRKGYASEASLRAREYGYSTIGFLIGTYTSRVRLTGKKVRGDWVQVAKYTAGGKIRFFKEYADMTALVEAMVDSEQRGRLCDGQLKCQNRSASRCQRPEL